MVKCVLPLTLVLVTGCASPPPIDVVARTITVKVPMYQSVYCDPPALGDPELPVSGLRPGTAPAETMRAFAGSIVILKGAVHERDEIIKGCEKPGAPSDAKGNEPSSAVAVTSGGSPLPR
jgi:hypothetical protein